MRAAAVRRRSRALVSAAAALLASAAVVGLAAPAAFAGPTAASSKPCTKGVPSTGWCGDGGPAVDARLASPGSIVALPDGGFAFADRLNSAVREVDATGQVSTLATLGGETGCPPGQLALAPDGRLLAAAPDCANVVAIAADGSVSMLAGDDPLGGAPTLGRLTAPTGVAVGPDGATFIADGGGILRLDADAGLSPLPLRPRIAATTLLATREGQLLAAGETAGIVWRVNPQSGRTRIVIGRPTMKRTAGGLFEIRYDPAVGQPSALAALPDGGFAFADRLHNRVRAVSASGRVRTLAGSGAAGFAGDGGRAVAASLSQPAGLAVRVDGGLLIADSGNDRIRVVSPRDGAIATVAGSGRPASQQLAPALGTHTGSAAPRIGCGVAGYCRSWPNFQPSRGHDQSFRRGRAVVIDIWTTLAADVTGLVRRGPRSGLTVHAHVGEGRGQISFGRLPAGTYTLQLDGRSGTLRRRFTVTAHVR